MRLKDSRHGTTTSAAQSSLMITINEEDRILGLSIIKISVDNPDTETRTTRHPINKLTSTQIGMEIQTQMNNSDKPDQVTPGPMGPKTVNKHSITSMLEQRTQKLNTTKTFHRATIRLHPTQSNSSMTMIQTG